MSDSSRIMVDIDELSSKLEAMQEDDYVTVELQIREDEYGYDKELRLSAVSLESPANVSYGIVPSVDEEPLEFEDD